MLAFHQTNRQEKERQGGAEKSIQPVSIRRDPSWMKLMGTFSSSLEQLVNRHQTKQGEAAGSGFNTSWSPSLSPLILDRGCGPALVLWRRNKHPPLQLRLGACVRAEELERRV